MSRKQYLLYILLGIILSPILFIISMYGLMLSAGPKLIEQQPAIALVVFGVDIIIITAYFFRLKQKRLKDMGHTDDTMIVGSLPGGDIFLNFLLFFSKSKKDSSNKSK